MEQACDVTVVICTLDRCAALERALASVLAQQAPETHYEVIVVDNGSTDGTRDVVPRCVAGPAARIRYVYEPRRGLAYARNAGVAAARAPVVAFTDDDQEVAPDWVSVLRHTFDRHPEVDAIGGRVRPVWGCEPPTWVSVAHHGPLSLIDRGPVPFYVNRTRWMCLSGGNFACRRKTLELLGGYSPEYPRSQDREFLVRLLQTGRQALYQPAMIAFHHIGPDRLTKSYFRRWHRIEGRMRAGFRFEELFDTAGQMWDTPGGGRQAFGVAGFVYRALIAELLGMIEAWALARTQEAFTREMRVLYLISYIRRRWELHLEHRQHPGSQPRTRIQPKIHACETVPRFMDRMQRRRNR